ncbi:MAG: HlyC/CorC family transporter [Proteobacteria bacterium]|nr:HlyC/CorC family transporter [Pseudomonadota bacterium]
MTQENIYTIIGTFVLLLIAAFFSAAETGLTAVSRAKIHKLKTEGNKRAVLVEKLRSEKEQLIAAILLLNNTLNIGASAMMTAMAIQLFGDDGILYATAVMTVMVFIFGEVLPKSYAFNFPEKVALGVAPLMRPLVWLLTPITATVHKIVNKALWVVGVRKGKGDMVAGVDVLRGAIDLHHQEGAVVKEDRNMLGSILDMSQNTVADIMVHRKKMFTIGLNQKQDKISRQILSAPYTRIPVWKDNPDNIVGIIHVKSFLKLLRATEIEGKPFDLSLAILEPWFVPSSITLKEQMHAFRERRSHMALVVDEYGDLQGLVTLEDIIEEIVGQIDDEHYSGTRMQTIIKEPDNTCVADGAVTIRDLNREMDWNIKDDEAATIAGFLIHEAQRIPDPGQVFHFQGYRFEVLHKQQHQLARLRISKLVERDDDYREEEEE